MHALIVRGIIYCEYCEYDRSSVRDALKNVRVFVCAYGGSDSLLLSV